MDLTFFGQDGLVFLADVVGDLHVCGPVGFADDFGFLGGCLAWWFEAVSFDDGD